MPLFSFMLYVFVTSFTPGPNNLMAMVSANNYGFKKTIKFCLGVGAGFFLIMVVCSFFNLLLKNTLPKIESIMTILGSMYMLYLAIKMIKSKNNNKSNDEKNVSSFYIGMFLQFINPKAILYGLTVISTFIIPYHHSIISLFVYSIFLALIGFVSTMCWSLFGSLFQLYLNKYRSQFNIVMSLLLVYIAVSIFFER